MQLDPVDALQEAILAGVMWTKSLGSFLRPGAVVEHSRSEVREALRQLTFRHVRSIRNDVVRLYVEDPSARYREARLRFDARLRRAGHL